MYKVNLTYFKSTGKYYSEGSYESEKEHLFEIFKEVHEKNNKGDLPGMCKGYIADFLLVDVPDHPHNYPYLVLGDWDEIVAFKNLLSKYQDRILKDQMLKNKHLRIIQRNIAAGAVSLGWIENYVKRILEEKE